MYRSSYGHCNLPYYWHLLWLCEFVNHKSLYRNPKRLNLIKSPLKARQPLALSRIVRTQKSAWLFSIYPSTSALMLRWQYLGSSSIPGSTRIIFLDLSTDKTSEAHQIHVVGSTNYSLNAILRLLQCGLFTNDHERLTTRRRINLLTIGEQSAPPMCLLPIIKACPNCATFILTDLSAKGRAMPSVVFALAPIQ